MDDPKMYDQALWAIRSVFELLDPRGSREERLETFFTKAMAAMNDSPKGSPTAEASARMHAAATLHEIKGADETSQWSTRIEIAIQDELRHLVDRLPDTLIKSEGLRELFLKRRVF
jgi:hypothetical protein